jgi:methyl-accepting chemotaxis protein
MKSHFNNLSIAKKLYGLAGVLLAFLAILGIVSLTSLGSANEKSDKMYTEGVVGLKAADDILLELDEQQQLTLASVMFAGDAKTSKLIADGYKKSQADLQKLLTATADPGAKQTAAEKKESEAFAASLTSLGKSQAAVFQASATGDLAAARTASTKAYETYMKTTAGFTAYRKNVVDGAKKENDSIESSFKSNRVLVIGLLGIALLIGAVVAFFTTRALRNGVDLVLDRLRSLQQNDTADLRGGLDAMAQGDLTVDVEPCTEPIPNPAKDELGQVADAVNGIRTSTAESIAAYGAMVENLRDLIGDVSTGASTVSSASQQMASTSEETGKAVGEIASAVGEVAQGAERQVRGVDSVKTAADGAATAARMSAEQAQQAAEVAEQARAAAREGVGAAEQANEAMDSVRGSSQSVTEAIRGLAAKSDEIGAIVATITGIADQTNLLALNAAIEAARAGEQGRGFAVVADEVRKLAEESQKAAGEIGSLIETIQADTGRAVEVVEDGARRTDDGAAVVEQTREAFERIGDAVDDVNERIGQIAAAAQQISAETEKMQSDIGEVAAVAEQSSASAEQVSASTQQTSASTQEIAASAQELASTASQLEQLVGRFKVAAVADDVE